MFQNEFEWSSCRKAFFVVVVNIEIMLYEAFLKTVSLCKLWLIKLLSVIFFYPNKVASRSLRIQNSLVYLIKIYIYIQFFYYFLTFSICSSLIKIWCPFSQGKKSFWIHKPPTPLSMWQITMCPSHAFFSYVGEHQRRHLLPEDGKGGCGGGWELEEILTGDYTVATA